MTLDFFADMPARLPEFDVRRVENSILLLPLQALLERFELKQSNAVESPAVRGCHRAQFGLGFRKCHIEAMFASVPARHQELKPERRLARARIPFDQIQVIRGKAALEDVIQTLDTGRYELL